MHLSLDKMDIACIEKEIAPILKGHGFNKRRQTWSRNYADLVQVLELQPSKSCQEGFYLNLGIYVKAIGTLKRPPESRCHIRRRPPRYRTLTMLEFSLDWFDQRTTLTALRQGIEVPDTHCLICTMASDYLKSQPLLELNHG